jgi:cytochrome P450
VQYCLGASPAKLEIELIFDVIADSMPDIAEAGGPVRLRSCCRPVSQSVGTRKMKKT